MTQEKEDSLEDDSQEVPEAGELTDAELQAGKSQLDARRRLEHLRELKRLREAIGDDYLDDGRFDDIG